MIRPKEMRKMLDEQSFKCKLTGVELTPQNAQLDHMLSIYQGGSNDRENVQAVHAVVNASKGRLSDSQFINMCHQVAKLHPDTGDDTWRVAFG